MNGVIVLGLVLTLLSEAPCRDVFDKTDACGAVDEESVALGADEVIQLTTERDEGAALRAPLLLGAAVAGTIGGALWLATGWSEQRLAALGPAPSAGVTRELLQREVAVQRGGAVGFLSTSGLLLGAGLAFVVFDPVRGAPRPPFIIEE